VSLRLYVEALGAVTQMVLNRTATIGIGGPLDAEIAGVERIGVGSVELGSGYGSDRSRCSTPDSVRTAGEKKQKGK
jgi:hypothetical protein